MSNPKISIITAVLNNKNLLERTIKSVAGQTYGNIEHIVIDGGSTDGSLDIIKKYQDRISYWSSEPDSGIYEAMNKGIKRATGDWILILNSDDYYISQDSIKKAVGRLGAPEKNFYYFAIVHEFENGTQKIYKHPIYWWNRWLLYYSAYIPHVGLFVSKEQYEKIGFYNVGFKIAADHDFILRLMKKYKPVFIDFPLTVMKLGGISSKDGRVTFREFCDATVKNGFPRILANLVFRFKMWKYKKF